MFRFKMFLWTALLVVLFLVAALPLFAQTSADPVVLPPLDLAGFIAQLLVVLTTLLGAWIGSPFTMYVVAFLKRFITGVPAEWLAVGTSLVLMIVIAVGAKLGVEAQVRQGISILTGFIAVLAGSGINLVQSAKRYNEALAQNAPLVGFQRTGPVAEQRALAQEASKYHKAA